MNINKSRCYCIKSVHALLFLLFIVSNLKGQFISAQAKDTIFIPEIRVSAELVEGELRQVIGSLSVLSTSQLESSNGLSIVDQLNSVPGVYMQNGTYTTNRIVVRGIGSRTPYSSNRIRAYLNDIPLTNGDGVTTIEDIDVEILDRVEIIKGPTSALYGSGLGGTLKLSTNKKDVIDFSYGLGSYNTSKLKAVAGTNIENGNITASYLKTKSDGYRENNLFDKNSLLLTANKSLDRTDYSLTFLFINYTAQIPSSLNLETYTNSPEKAASNWLAAKGYEENLKVNIGLSVRHRFTDKLSNKTTLFTIFNESFEHRPFNDLDDRSNSYGVRNQLHYHENNLDLILGLELFTENYKWSTSLKTDNDIQLLNDISENRNFANVFGLINYSFTSKIKSSFALNMNTLNYRFNALNNDEEYRYPVILSPRFGVNYEFNEDVNFYTSLGHGFSPPSLEETLRPDGEKNLNLKPEQGLMYEIGARLSGFNKRLFIDATLYTIALNNMLVTKRISEEIFTGINAGKSNLSGIEIQANYSLLELKSFPGNLSLNGSYSISNNIFKNFIDDGVDFSGNELPGIPNQTLYTGLIWNPVNSLSVFLNYRFTGEQYLNDGNSEKNKSYSVINSKFKYEFQFVDRFNIYITGGINNVLDTKYASMILVNAPSFGGAQPRYYYPGLPRNYFMSMGILF